MKTALTIWLGVALALHVISHVAITVGLLRKRLWRRAAIGFFLPPLGALFGWEADMKWRARGWAVTLVAYAIGVAAS